jgi:hypothetical protein
MTMTRRGLLIRALLSVAPLAGGGLLSAAESPKSVFIRIDGMV